MIKQFKAKSFFSALLLIIIVFVMGLSGINQIFSNNDNDVAQVGKIKISTEEYTRVYDLEKTRITQMLGTSLSPDQLKTLGFKRLVLDKIIQDKLLDSFTHSLKLETSDRSISNVIKTVEEFQDSKGAFDKEKFISILQNNNIDKSKYIKSIKNSILKDIILDPFKQFPMSSLSIAEKIYQYRFETRTVDIITLTPDMVKKIPKPSDETLNMFYQEHQGDFQSPETRIAQYIMVTNNNIDNNVIVDEQEVSTQFKYLKDRVDIAYVVFNTLAEAQDTSSKLIKEKRQITDLSEHKILTNLNQTMLPEYLQAIFNLTEHDISPPIQSPSGFYLIQIEKKYEVDTEAGDNIKSEIRRQLHINQMNENLEIFVHSVEKELALDEAIEIVANKYNLKISEIGPIEINHENQNLAQLIFNQEQDKQNNHSFINVINDDGMAEYYHIQLTTIIPSQTKEFNECKKELEEAWSLEFINRRLYEIATNVDVEHPSKREQIVRTQVAYTESPEQNYPENFINQIFSLSAGESTTPLEYKTGVIVGRVVGTNKPKENHTLAEEIEVELKRNILEGMYNEFKHHLQRKFTVSINPQALPEE